MCGGSSCGGLPSPGTIQPRCCPPGCFFWVITVSNPEVRWPKRWPTGLWKGGGKLRNSNGQGGIRTQDALAGIPVFETAPLPVTCEPPDRRKVERDRQHGQSPQSPDLPDGVICIGVAAAVAGLGSLGDLVQQSRPPVRASEDRLTFRV